MPPSVPPDDAQDPAQRQAPTAGLSPGPTRGRAPERVPSPPDSRWIDRTGGRLIAGVIRYVERSSTEVPLLEENVREMAKNHPMIIAMWHGQFMMLPTMMRFGLPVKAMLALHKDAEALAEALRHFGIDLIRGAGAGGRSKDRGGANAFRAALEALESGFSVAMTADVPPGPARRAGHGIVTLAKISGRPILPVAIASSRYISFNSWSRMTINLPYSRLGGSIGQVIHVPRNATKEELEACRQEVERQLHIATFDSYLRADADPRRSTPGPALRVMGHAIDPGPSLRLYRGLSRIARPALPLLLKRRMARGKEDPARIGERYGRPSRARPDGALVWFHAASVGETLSVGPLIGELVAARPDVHVLLTTGTTTAADLARKRMPAAVIHQFAPLDLTEHAHAFLDHWKPAQAYLVESEIWPNMVLELGRRGTPITLVNARMSRASFRRWRFLSGASRPIFSRIDRALAQNATYASYFRNLGVANIQTTGNLKIDTPPLPVDQALARDLKAAIGSRPVLLAVSTHPGEDEVIVEAHRTIARTMPDVLTILAPRHPERGRTLADMLNRDKWRVSRRADGKWPNQETDIWIADTLGELGALFAVAPIAVVGGSFVKLGGHNPVEPIRAGVVPITGPS
ncbi:MAG: hypothetical protein RL291_1702, partial [Pseudomonadota bacterium]